MKKDKVLFKIIHNPHELFSNKTRIYVSNNLRRYVPRFAKPRAWLAGLAEVMLLTESLFLLKNEAWTGSQASLNSLI